MYSDDAFAADNAWVEAAPSVEVPSADKRVALVLLLDTSSSMSRPPEPTPIAQLNSGLQILRQILLEDEDARARVDVAVVTFGGSAQIQDLQGGYGQVSDAKSAFVPARTLNPPTLSADGLTPMAAGLRKALEIIELRKAHYRAEDLPYFRPWLMLITDGEPTDSDSDWLQVVQQIHAAQEQKKVALFAIGVENAEMVKLNELVWKDPRHPERWRPAMKLDGLKFQELFQWLSASVGVILDSSDADTQVQFPATNGWAQMDL